MAFVNYDEISLSKIVCLVINALDSAYYNVMVKMPLAKSSGIDSDVRIGWHKTLDLFVILFNEFLAVAHNENPTAPS